MSTFNGKIVEIPEISVDRFDGENSTSTIYFLSHCHTDHMRGLEDWAFQQSLVRRSDVFLYASSISIKILKHLYPSIESKLKVLPLENPMLIKFPHRQDETLTVSCMPAGHCPGSVMFLFETKMNILYTGDYRVGPRDLKKYKAFYCLGKRKKIHKLYLDTTFFKKSFSTWPFRQESLESICEIIKEWTEKSKDHIVKIVLSAKYGSEFLFIEIAKALCMPVHVSLECYNLYRHIPEMDEAITRKRNKTQIHAGCGINIKSICIRNNDLVRVVIPSALWWEGNNFSKGITVHTGKEEYRVCYSCHASYEEIKDFLLFLKPLEIEPCVVPNDDTEKEIMLALLEQTVRSYLDAPPEEELNLSNLLKGSPRPPVGAAIAEAINSPPKMDDNLEEFASPPTNFKRKRLWLNEENEGN